MGDIAISILLLALVLVFIGIAYLALTETPEHAEYLGSHADHHADFEKPALALHETAEYQWRRTLG
ncbi:MAG: hypothetical protein HYT41_02185 [Candidatus Sungbacteria bacterium]|nr:hypothetical protein [Candidatus Sungbacteria bacterium]